MHGCRGDLGLLSELNPGVVLGPIADYVGHPAPGDGHSDEHEHQHEVTA